MQRVKNDDTGWRRENKERREKSKGKEIRRKGEFLSKKAW